MPRKLQRIEPKIKYDFILYLSKGYDEVGKQKFLKFVIETTQHFLAFNYELDIDVSVNDREITFEIHGFKCPSSPVSRSGPARFEYNLYDYKDGLYSLTVVKKEKLKNTFAVFIFGDKITLKSEPRKNKFVKLNIIES